MQEGILSAFAAAILDVFALVFYSRTLFCAGRGPIGRQLVRIHAREDKGTNEGTNVGTNGRMNRGTNE